MSELLALYNRVLAEFSLVIDDAYVRASSDATKRAEFRADDRTYIITQYYMDPTTETTWSIRVTNERFGPVRNTPITPEGQSYVTNLTTKQVLDVLCQALVYS